MSFDEMYDIPMRERRDYKRPQKSDATKDLITLLLTFLIVAFAICFFADKVFKTTTVTIPVARAESEINNYRDVHSDYGVIKFAEQHPNRVVNLK